MHSTRTLIATLLGTLVFAHAALASADEMAGLQVELGSGIDAVVRADLEAAVDSTMNSVSQWDWIPERKAKSSMNPVVRGCFTGDCLSKAGDATGADAGLRIRLSGEAQIYDWQIDIYDLDDGSLLRNEKGACELCGRSEVVRVFRESLRDTVVATRLPRRKPVATSTTKPPKRTPPQPTDEPTDEPTQTTGNTEPETTAPTTTEPTGADRAGLVMLDVSVQPPDAAIEIEGEKIGTGTATVSLEPGTYELKFSLEGYQGFTESFVVSPQTSRRAFMRIHLSKTDPDPVMVSASEGAVDRLGNQRVTYGVISLAVGGVLVGTGIWLNAIDGDPACEDGAFTDCPELYNTGTASVVTTLGGAALATGGAILLAWDVLAGKKKEPAEKQARITPLAGPGGVGLGVVGRF